MKTSFRIAASLCLVVAGAIVFNSDLLRAQLSSAAQIGEWSGVINLPLVPIHTILLPNGNVLMWNHGHNDLVDSNTGQRFVKDDPTPYLWNPLAPTNANNPILLRVPDLFANGEHSDEIYCSGHSLLADGRVVVAGGHLSKFNSDRSNKVNLEWTGSPQIHFFDYTSNTWLLNQTQMNEGRWYPSTMPMGNGNNLIVGGMINQDVDGSFIYNLIPQIYNATNGTIVTLSNASRLIPTYPWMYAAPGGAVGSRAFYAGPGPDTGFLTLTGQGSWGPAIPTAYGFLRSPGGVHQSTSVLYDEGKILNVGGVNMSGQTDPSTAPPTNTAEAIDLKLTSPSWRAVAPMNYPRQHHTATLLPDGKVLVTGGSSAAGFSNVSGAVYAAEMWDPAAQTFAVMSSMSVPRLHHSVALLLPDGRVLVGGSGETGFPGEVDHRDVQFYSPPYLFKGARPVITSLNTSINYGQPFLVGTTANNIAKVVLIRLGAVSHGFNFNQSVSQLNFKKRNSASVLDVTAPIDRNIVPPGHYMLFIVTSSGIPSTARIVQIT
jgi:hypothetical protein